MKVFVFAALLWVAAADDPVPAQRHGHFITHRPTLFHGPPTYSPSSSYGTPTHTPSSSYATPASHSSSSYGNPTYVERSYAPSYQEPQYYAAKPYAFEYGVNDPHTGTVFSESRQSDGTTTTGQYSVNLPDGCIQTVTYTADDYHGYQADVTYDCPATPSYAPARSSGYEAPSHQPTGSYSYDAPVYQPARSYQSPTYYQPPTVAHQRSATHQQQAVRTLEQDD